MPSILKSSMGGIFRLKNDPESKTRLCRIDIEESVFKTHIKNSVWHSKIDNVTGDPTSPTREAESSFLSKYEFDDKNAREMTTGT